MLLNVARRVGTSRWDWASIRIVAVATAAVTGVILGARHLGWLQPLELIAYDRMVRLRATDTELDPRLLIVAITERDIERQNQWPLSDRVLAQLLQQVQRYNPAAIGLDLYRNLPVESGYDELVAQLQQPNIIAIQSIDPLLGTPAPPAVSPDRVGFNDIPIDPDNVVRRNLLFAENEQGFLPSFALQLALTYLRQQGISPEPSPQNPDYLKLGSSVFVPLQPDSGGYQTIEADGYQILLNYRRPGQLARQVTLHEFLSGQVEPSWVEGKIVTIGSVAPSLKDNFTTPYSPGLRENHKMSGVLIHTQMVSQLLDAASGDRPLFRFWLAWQEIIWIALWTLAGGLLGRIAYHPLAVTVGTTAGLCALWSACFYLFTQAIWVPLASPGLGFVLTVGIVITYRSHHAHQKQQIVMKLLGQNTSPEIAHALWKDRDRLLKSGKLPGTRLDATMLFADIKNFSTLSEQMSPECLLDWLNEILEAITHEVLKRQGIVNKFTGDGVMAAFGVPTSELRQTNVADDARSAVACALSICDRLDQMNQNWQHQGLPAIQMRIGIYTGSVIAGSLGGKDRLEYGVIGDSVNIAARLESCEKHRQPTHCRILIGRETLVHLQDRYEVESWGLLALKGKQQMVDVYRVVALRQDRPSLSVK